MEDFLLDILDHLRSLPPERAGDALTPLELDAIWRRHNRGAREGDRRLSKRFILPFYQRTKQRDPIRWASWNVDATLEERLVRTIRMKPRRTASGVATITVITRPQACSSDCLYCPCDLRMPKSYLAGEPACQRAEHNFFDPYLQVASRLRALSQMGHSVDKVELKRPRPRFTVVELYVFDETGVLTASFFGQPWLAEQVKRGELPMFNSHMWDGSAEALDDNIEIAVDMLKRAKAANVVLEIEIGAVGGEEDGIKGEENANLYTTADDAWKAIEALGLGENGRYITALTFGNVHGSYKPGHVKLRPEILGEIQEDVAKRLGDRLSSKVGDKSSPFDLVMHGGSGSTDEEIATAVRNGVIKMNVDTDTQYAYTRPVAGWMYTNYEGVLKIDGEVGNKKQYDPRAWGKAAEEGMAARVVEACERLGSVGSARK